MRLRRARLLLAVMIACLYSGACASWKAARPTVICGTTVSSGGSGVIVARPVELVASVKSDGGRPYQFFPSTLILVSDSCRKGATVTIDPPGGVTITPLALAKDGRPVVVGLSAQQSVNVTMTVAAGGSVSQVRMTVIAFPVPSSVYSSTSPG